LCFWRFPWPAPMEPPKRQNRNPLSMGQDFSDKGSELCDARNAKYANTRSASRSPGSRACGAGTRAGARAGNAIRRNWHGGRSPRRKAAPDGLIDGNSYAAGLSRCLLTASVDVNPRDTLFQTAVPVHKTAKDRIVLYRIPAEIMIIAGRCVHDQFRRIAV
jgi:hypothetical protein